MSKRHDKHDASGTIDVPTSKTAPVQQITVTMPPSRFDKVKIGLDSFATLAIFLTLCLSYWQFRVADRKEHEAAVALKIADKAQQETVEAERRIMQHERDITNLATRLQQSAQLAQIHDWTIRAEAGDRDAFVALQRYVRDTATNSPLFVISLAQKNVNRIYRLFSGDQIMDPDVAYEESSMSWAFIMQDTNRIPAFLKSDDYRTRAMAVGTIGTMRLNSYIPQLADIAFQEPDLHVLQFIVKTIEKAFDPSVSRNKFTVGDFLFPYYEGRKKFDDQWAQFGPDILRRKPKYVVSEPLGPNGSRNKIVDPEAEQQPAK